MSRRVRRFLGSPTPGMPSFVKCSYCVCGAGMAATSLRRRELASPEKTISYQFRGDVVVYIMAGAGVFRLRWCAWLTNNLGGLLLLPDCISREEKPMYVQNLIQPPEKDCGI